MAGLEWASTLPRPCLSRQLKLRFVCQPLKKVALMAPFLLSKFQAA